MSVDNNGTKTNKKEVIDKETAAYLEFFKDSIDALQQNYDKSVKYSETLDGIIDKLKSAPATSPKALSTLSEIMESAVSLQSQRQSNLKDIFVIKKAILDYTFKEKGEDTSDVEKLIKNVKQIIKSDKDKTPEQSEQSVDELNAQITKKLDEEIA